MINNHLDPLNILRILIAPFGAFFALIGFFIVPWAKVTVFFVESYVPGYAMGFVVWLIPVICLGIIGISFLSLVIRQVLILRICVGGLAAFGLFLAGVRVAIMIFEIFRAQGAQIMPHFGIPITIFGLLIAIVGGIFLPTFRR